MTQDPHDPQDLLLVLAKRDAEFAGGNAAAPAKAPIVLADRDGGSLVLRIDEAELYSLVRNRLDRVGDDGVTDTRTVEALERLGRSRAVRLLELRDTLQGATLRELADKVRGTMSAAIAELERTEYPSVAGGMGVVELVNAYQALEAMAQREERAVEIEAGLALEYDQLRGAVTLLVDVARELGADTFEGRLEGLGDALENLADVTGEMGPRS